MFHLPTPIQQETAFKFIYDLINFVESPQRHYRYMCEAEVVPFNLPHMETLSWIREASFLPGMLDLYNELCWSIAIRTWETNQELTFNYEIRLFEPFISIMVERGIVCDELLYCLVAATDMHHDVEVASLISETAVKWSENGEYIALARLVGLSIGHGHGVSFALMPECIPDFVNVLKRREVHQAILNSLVEEACYNDYSAYTTVESIISDREDEIQSYAQLWAALFLGFDEPEEYAFTEYQSDSDEIPDHFWALAKGFEREIINSLKINFDTLQPLRAQLCWDRHKKSHCALSTLDNPIHFLTHIDGDYHCHFITEKDNEYLALIDSNHIKKFNAESLEYLNSINWSYSDYYKDEISKHAEFFTLAHENNVNSKTLVLIEKDMPPIFFNCESPDSQYLQDFKPHFISRTECGRYLTALLDAEISPHENSVPSLRFTQSLMGGTVRTLDLLSRRNINKALPIYLSKFVIDVAYASSEKVTFVLAHHFNPNANDGYSVVLSKYNTKGKLLASITEDDYIANTKCAYTASFDFNGIRKIVIDDLNKNVYCVHSYGIICFSLENLALKWQTARLACRYSISSLMFKKDTLKILPKSRDIMIASTTEGGNLIRWSYKGELIQHYRPIHPKFRSLNSYQLSVSENEDKLALSITTNDDQKCVCIMPLK